MISNNRYNRDTRDVVVVAMTSNPEVTDYSLPNTSVNLISGKLNRPGKVRVDKIYTMSQAIIVKTFGRVDSSTLDRVRSALTRLIS